MKKAVFFDRDGIINEAIIKNGKPYSPKNLDEFKFVKGIGSLIWNLTKKRFFIFVITNQPDVARGTQTKKEIKKIHNKIKDDLFVDKIYTCFHDDKDNCKCRKPKSGMILKSAKEFNIDLKNSWVIGDRLKDVLAGINAGCKTIFVDYGYEETTDIARGYADFIVKNIKEIERIIL